MNLEQLIQSFFRKQIDQYQQVLIKETEVFIDSPNEPMVSNEPMISNEPMTSKISISKEPPWEVEVPPDSIQIDLQEKIDKYAIPPQKVNPYDGREGKLKHRQSAYREQLSIKNHPKKGLKASI